MNPNGNPTWVVGRKLPDEIKEKIRAKAIGRVVSDEARAKMSQRRMGNQYAKGTICPPERKEAISRALKGRVFSEETKRKISENRKGKHPPREAVERMRQRQMGKHPGSETRQKMSAARKGKLFTEEHKRHLSESQVGKRCGVLAPGWRGGINGLPYAHKFTRQLKRLIRDRDNHSCQACGIPEVELTRNLDIHHINYNKQDSLPNNLICLCKNCHSKTNFRRDYWQAFLSAILVERGYLT